MSQTTLPEVERLAVMLSFEDQLRLLEHVTRFLISNAPPKRQPQDLYGAFRGEFPAGFDVDAAIHEARTAWKADFDNDNPSDEAGEGNQ